MPMFQALGPVEDLLTKADERAVGDEASSATRVGRFVRAAYLRDSIAPNLDLAKNSPSAAVLVKTYEDFLRTMHSVLLERGDSLIARQTNLFTTNVDVAIEAAASVAGVHLNDGFTGSIAPRFSSSNFNLVAYRRSQFRDRLSEVPNFNLVKLHGSVNWALELPGQENSHLGLDADLAQLDEAIDKLVPILDRVPTLDESTEYVALLESLGAESDLVDELSAFAEAFDRLQLINPTKAKFHDTVFRQTYYDLLRTFANELEKPNSALFAIGFSFRDEHICELVQKAAASNPTLHVYVFAHSTRESAAIADRLAANASINRNIKVIQPTYEGDVEIHLTLDQVRKQFFGNIAPLSLST